MVAQQVLRDISAVFSATKVRVSCTEVEGLCSYWKKGPNQVGSYVCTE